MGIELVKGDFIGWKELLKTDATFKMIYEEYVEQNITGGSLHIVLDGGNNDDDCIGFCFNFAKERGDIAGMYIASKLINVEFDDRYKYEWGIPDEDEL